MTSGSPSEGLSLLGAYEDSEEEDTGDTQPPAGKSQLNQSADIDSTLANFMAVSIFSRHFQALREQGWDF